MRYFAILFLLLFSSLSFSQGNKTMDPSVYESWNKITDNKISNNGDWISYNLTPGKGDKSLVLYNNRTGKEHSFARSASAQIDQANNFVAFLSSPSHEKILELKRKKVKKKKMPKDTLKLFNTKLAKPENLGAVKSFKLPEDWGNFIVYHLADKRDTNKTVKKESKKNGSKLVLYNVYTDWKDTLHYITDYSISEKGKFIAAVSTGIDSTEKDHIIVYDLIKKQEDKIVARHHGFHNLVISPKANYLTYMENIDSSEKAQVPNYSFHLYDIKSKSNKTIRNPRNSDLILSKDRKPIFSEDETRLYFGMAPQPIVQDTNLLEEEIVNVEVWTSNDKKLYTQKEVQLKNEKKRSFLYAYDVIFGKSVPLGNKNVPRVFLSEKKNAKYAVGVHTESYEQYISWKGYPYNDVYIINVETGRQEKVLTKEQGRIRISPKGNYAFWYNAEEKANKTIDLATGKVQVIADESVAKFYNELHDAPSNPWPYGIATWSDDEKFVYIYDRFDIWKIASDGSTQEKLTDGREKQIRYRYINLDSELKSIPQDTSILLYSFNEKDKSSGYVSFNLKSKESTLLEHGHFRYDRTPIKAKNSEDLIITREDFDEFPNLISTTLGMEEAKKISDANPQQKDYLWGDAELYSWTNEKGEELEGLLIKPDNFNPASKYPMIVNFYERSSDGLYRHRAPAPHRSTINYSYYVNKGFIIFNPNVTYNIGYPGESCYEDVISGVQSLSKKPWVDKSNIGVQGHSWGGYQIAHLLTKTNIFKCAEAGAPVVNMVSAYGGIRWRSGLSRMFQYEKTQSRLGATLWENPQLYLENSPIFNVDKVNTPVLILHNDKDGAVPWYQGIEYFVALRRLGKPAWLLNYNGEPHWPVKWQNRVDFNKRMEQFFSHYLLGHAKPQWMETGVAPIDKGINQGLDLMRN